MNEPTNDKLAAPEQGQAVQPVESDKAVETAQKTETNVSTDKSQSNGQPTFDPQKSYQDLQKSYQELRGFATRTSMERAELAKKLESIEASHKQLSDMLAKAMETPVNPEELIRDPKAFREYLDKHLNTHSKAQREEYDKTVKELNSKVSNYEYKLEELTREYNAKDYPGWKELKPTMVELAQDPNCPINFNQPIGNVLDALYKLARDRNGDEAIKQAEAMARKKAEADIANEAKTSVATGGKTGASTPQDLRNMPFNKLEEVVTQMVGVADRD